MCAEDLLEGVWVCWVQFIGQIIVWQIAINQEPEGTRQGNDKDIYDYYYGRKEQAVLGGWLQEGADTGVE